MISLIADRRDIAAGARAMVPWVAGVLPVGLVVGVSAARADVPTLAGLIFFSATMARHWRGTPWWWRFAPAYLLVDPSLAVGLASTSTSGNPLA